MNICCICAQSCPTLWGPMDWSPPGSSSMKFSRQEYWSELPFPTPGDLPDPGIEPGPLGSPGIDRWVLITSASWEAPNIHTTVNIHICYVCVRVCVCVKQVNKKGLWYTTGSHTQYFIRTHKGKECEKEHLLYTHTHICTSIAEFLCGIPEINTTLSISYTSVLKKTWYPLKIECDKPTHVLLVAFIWVFISSFGFFSTVFPSFPLSSSTAFCSGLAWHFLLWWPISSPWFLRAHRVRATLLVILVFLRDACADESVSVAFGHLRMRWRWRLRKWVCSVLAVVALSPWGELAAVLKTSAGGKGWLWRAALSVQWIG